MASVNRGNFKYRSKEDQAKAAAKRSYNSYIRNRQKLLDQGYSLERKLSFDEYYKNYQLAKHAKLPFNGRLIANYDKSFGKAESKRISKMLDKKGYEMTAEEIRSFGMEEKTREEEFKESTRAAFFTHLLNQGLSYDEAERVMY